MVGLISALLVVAALLYWQLVMTEGVFFGKRFVVWLYDITAYRYDKIKEHDVADEILLVVEPLLAGCRVEKPKLLDIATGTGRVPYYVLLDGRFSAEITAIDPSAKMLSHAHTKMATLPNQPHNVIIEQRHAVPLPYSDGAFDVVTCLEALEFMPSDEAALREMWRVLKVGGYMMTTRRADWEAPFFLHRHRTRAEMTTLLETIGFHHVYMHDWQSNYDLVTMYKPRLTQ